MNNLNVPEKPFITQQYNKIKDIEKNSFKYTDLKIKLVEPHQKKEIPANVDVSSFGRIFTDHMLKISYKGESGGWQKPEIVPLENISLHPAAKVFNYATELYEGFKAYKGVDGKVRIFRPQLNMKRMNVTAARASLPLFDEDELLKCISRLVSADRDWVPSVGSGSLYVRPVFIGTDASISIAKSDSDSALLYVILSPVGSYLSAGDGAISLMANPEYVRAWPGGVGDKKMGSNYGPTVLVQDIARRKGLTQVLWLYGDDHQLTEAGTMNMFIVYLNDEGEKVLVTPPLDGTILPGIHRHSVIQLVEHWGMKTEERPFTMKEVIRLLKDNRLLEMFGTGTASSICPVGLIEYMDQKIRIPTVEQPDPVYKRARSTLEDIQYGRIEHPWGYVV